MIKLGFHKTVVMKCIWTHHAFPFFSVGFWDRGRESALGWMVASCLPGKDGGFQRFASGEESIQVAFSGK